MRNQRAIAALLFVIALCLVLITGKLYDIDLVDKAYAQRGSAAMIFGCYIPPGKVQSEASCQWVPVKVTEKGVLLRN